MKKLSILLLFSILSLFLVACNSTTTENESAAKNESKKLNIYTTVYPLSYFAQKIGGDYVEVTSIYPPGSNEHTFEPTQKDMMQLADADLFFYIGLGLEGFVENAQKTLANENVKLVATADRIAEEHLHTSVVETEEDHHEEHEDHQHGDIDPHVWLSPIIAKDLALSIKDELVTALPDQEASFNENYNQLISELDSLNSDFENMVSEVPNKTFFVSHASFGYIAGQYGLKQVAIAGLNSQSEPSQKELIEIVNLAKDLNVEYILFEQNISSKLSTIIQNEVGAKALTLHNLSVLTEEDITNNETYITLMEKNIDTLRQALQ
ncbi:zinc transport system substrate-binding protein [Ureibacillus xyleni]|uniref:Zinc transport system substrate-binding protein n=1 Tax=Ureibacillus xyleni TaxID=614648 RepID=A0A285SCJ9_9BACL|nr:zinc ABC transporter substrate-binding protein [Ureibacillus xyleni]SOC03500.1 zinc transport system substrate-binding protein [Ureibacillus xyleni]